LDSHIQYACGAPESENVSVGSKTLIEILEENDILIDSDGNLIVVNGEGLEIPVSETGTVPDIPELPPLE